MFGFLLKSSLIKRIARRVKKMAKAVLKKKAAPRSRAMATRKKAPARRRGASRARAASSIKKMGTQAIMGGIFGAVGAIGAGIALSKISDAAPGNRLLSDPSGRAAVSSAIAIGLGYLVSKMLKKPVIGAGMATGGAAVGIYSIAKPHVEKALSLKLDGTQSLLSSDLLGSFYSAGPNFKRPSAMNPRNIPAVRR